MSPAVAISFFCTGENFFFKDQYLFHISKSNNGILNLYDQLDNFFQDLYSPDLEYNLSSVSTFEEARYSILC